MPNWFHNKLKFIGDDEEIKKALAFISSDKGPLDLNKIKAMPDELQVSNSNGFDVLYLISGQVYEGKSSNIDEIQKRFCKLSLDEQTITINQALKYFWNIEKYGHPTWYEWRIENWGTKWNVSDSEIDPKDNNAIFFDAANAPAMDAMIELSRLFPKLTLNITYFDPLSYRGSFNLNNEEVSDFIKEYSLLEETEEALRDEIIVPDEDEIAEILNQPAYDFFEEEPEDEQIISDEAEYPECHSDDLY